MVDLSNTTVEVTREQLRRQLHREADLLKRQWFADLKRQLIEAGAEDFETVEVTGSSFDDASTGALDAVQEYSAIPDDADIVEVHIQVDQPTTVRYIGPDESVDPGSDDSGASE